MRRMFFLIVIGLFLSGMILSGSAAGEDSKMKAQLMADLFVSEAIFIKDPRIDSCFAFFRPGTISSGGTMAEVSCEKIPPELLTTGQMPKKK